MPAAGVAETFALADAIRGQLGAAGAGRFQRAQRRRRIPRWPSLCARSRISASRSTRSSARSTTFCRRLDRARREGRRRRSRPRSTSCARERDKARAGDQAERFPSYADLVDPKPPTVDQIKATLRRARRCCRSISAARQLRLGGAEGRPGGVCGDQGHAPATSRPRSASCARRSSRRRR